MFGCGYYCFLVHCVLRWFVKGLCLRECWVILLVIFLCIIWWNGFSCLLCLLLFRYFDLICIHFPIHCFNIFYTQFFRLFQHLFLWGSHWLFLVLSLFLYLLLSWNIHFLDLCSIMILLSWYRALFKGFLELFLLNTSLLQLMSVLMLLLFCCNDCHIFQYCFLLNEISSNSFLFGHFAVISTVYQIVIK
jgi:hypothetical protein